VLGSLVRQKIPQLSIVLDRIKIQGRQTRRTTFYRHLGREVQHALLHFVLSLSVPRCKEERAEEDGRPKNGLDSRLGVVGFQYRPKFGNSFFIPS